MQQFGIEISDSDFEISDVNEQTRHLNYNDSVLCSISTSEAELLLKQSSSFRAHLDWSVKKVCVSEVKMIDPEQGSLKINKFPKVEVFCSCIQFCLIFHFFNDHFILFVLASVATNHKTTEEDVLNKIARILKHTPGKIGAEVEER